MAESNVSILLDPRGEKLQTAAQGAPNAGRVAVTVHWVEIENALDLGFTISAIHRVLSTEKVVSVSLRTFTRQVQALRKAKRVSRAAGKPPTPAERRASGGAADPVSEPPPLPQSAPAAEEAQPDDPAPAEASRAKLPEIKPGIPHRPWRTGREEPPNPKAVFRPRDPLADD